MGGWGGLIPPDVLAFTVDHLRWSDNNIENFNLNIIT